MLTSWTLDHIGIAKDNLWFTQHITFAKMYGTRFMSILLFNLLAESLFALPYIFQRAVNDTTALAPSVSSVQQDLGRLLSKGATLYFPGSLQFANATSRWSAYAEPQIAVVVEPTTAEDVSTTVRVVQ